MIAALSFGFRLTRRHPGLVALLWAAPFLPALALTLMAATNIGPVLGRSTFADRVLTGDTLRVWSELRDAPIDDLTPILGPGLLIAVVFVGFMQVLLAAGLVEAVLERPRPSPFWFGLKANLFRFLRTALLHAILSGIAIGLALAVSKGFSKLAESQADGRFDLIGFGAAGLVFLMLWAPLDLASDLSRLAASRHNERSMTFGYFRALWSVLRRPRIFVPLYGVFLGLPVVIHTVFGFFQGLSSQDSMGSVLVVLVIQQAAMIARAFVKLSIWGAEAHVYRALGEPQFCRPRKRKTAPKAPALPIEHPTPITEANETAEPNEAVEPNETAEPKAPPSTESAE